MHSHQPACIHIWKCVFLRSVCIRCLLPNARRRKKGREKLKGFHERVQKVKRGKKIYFCLLHRVHAECLVRCQEMAEQSAGVKTARGGGDKGGVRVGDGGGMCKHSQVCEQYIYLYCGGNAAV